jgi:hypothetical protein
MRGPIGPVREAVRAGADEIEVTVAGAGGVRRHYRSLVQLHDPAVAHQHPGMDGGAHPPAPAPLAELAPFPLAIEDAYRDLLFHGPIFQGIAAIDGMDERGASAVLSPSQPGHCVAGAAGQRWLLDPVLLDSALQVQVLWARLQWDVTLLPAEIGGYVRVSAPSEGERVRHELRIRPASSPPLCHADHWFYGADGRLLAMLQDVVGVGTQALNRLAGVQA